MRHRPLTISIQSPHQVPHFESQMAVVFTSYNPFDFSKVASDHVPLGAAFSGPGARNPQAA
jgi:hypothetical protein